MLSSQLQSKLAMNLRKVFVALPDNVNVNVHHAYSMLSSRVWCLQGHCSSRIKVTSAGLQRQNATLDVAAAQHKQDNFALFLPIKLTMGTLEANDQYSCG